METLAKADTVSIGTVVSRTALSVLEDLKVENQRIREELVKTTGRLTRVVPVARKSRIRGAVALLLAYMLLTVVVVVWSKQDRAGVESIFRGTVIEAWRWHLGLLTIVVGYGILHLRRWRQWFRWLRQADLEG